MFFFLFKGQLVVYMFGYLYDLEGVGVKTVDSIPKKDWCRVLFTVNENTVNIEGDIRFDN